VVDGSGEDEAAGRVYRLGGDEFVVVLPGISDREALARAGSDAVVELSRPFRLGSAQAWIGASVGASLCPDDGPDPSALLANADEAMHAAKRAGAGQVHLFQATMLEAARARAALDAELREALASGALVVHYQPLVSLHDGRVLAFEALVRWPRPDGSWISPAVFVPLAEQAGLVVELDRLVLQRACAAARLPQNHHASSPAQQKAVEWVLDSSSATPSRRAVALGAGISSAANSAASSMHEVRPRGRWPGPPGVRRAACTTSTLAYE
jgi:predicted signal transduction protein with EAL and GGDEF domain